MFLIGQTGSGHWISHYLRWDPEMEEEYDPASISPAMALHWNSPRVGGGTRRAWCAGCNI